MFDPKKEAMELLKSPDFFSKFLRAVRVGGLIGEKNNALVVFIVAVSRLLPDPLQLFVKGNSSAGKNFLVRKVLQFLPGSQVCPISSTSANVLSYEGKKLAHKVLYVHELNKSTGSVHPTRLLISEGVLIREVTERKGGKLTRKRYVTKGPVACIATTTEDELEVDDESRRLSIWIDESKAQTRRIVEGTWSRSSLMLTPKEEKIWHYVQRLLAQRAKVPIVFPNRFSALSGLITCDELRLRRYAKAFKEACQTVCLIRSFRKSDQEIARRGELRVCFSDVAITQMIFEDSLVGSLYGRPSEEDRVLTAVKRVCEENGGAPVKAAWVSYDLGFSKDKAYALLRDAVRKGTIRRVNKPQQTNVKLYLPAPKPVFLPDPGVIFNKLGFKGRVKFIHPLTGDRVVFGKRGNGR